MQAGVKFHPFLATTLALAVLAGCSSGYQAPLDDRSTVLERSPPIIVSGGQEVAAIPRQAPATSSSTSAAVSDSAVGATSTVVRPVTISSGISSSGISRAPQSEQNAAVPATEPSASSPALRPEPAAAPTARPAPNATPAATASSDAPAARTPTIYEVGRGDTLYSIAWNHSIDYRTLALVNNLEEPYTIYPGQRLVISDRGVSAAAISALPAIPAAPAGEEAMSATGRRPQAAMDARRTGSVEVRQVEGVSWQWPVDGRVLGGSGAGRGLELAGRAGESVYAAADGDVVFAGRGIQGAGNLVILRHSARHLSAYMHNSLMLVVEGDRVQAGDKIAEVGMGPDGRPMLRFEIRVDGAPVDPARYLPVR